VSGKKIRYKDKDFDLDLTYITERVIAMGFPAIGSEGLYRNQATVVRKFLEKNHNNNIKIYNLCKEHGRSYGQDRFPEFTLAKFGFADHNVCSI
jgi:phosphatidylinositol-3,4,5-trisphosphate 3-phosphatase/dual-specificity protein phosphatase PTEN